MTRSIGYQYLIEHFGLNVCSLLGLSYEVDKSQKETRIERGVTAVYYPTARIRIGDAWQDNLVFALKYEGVNLEVLKAFFARVSDVEVERFVRDAPLGVYARKTWFLYEWLTDRRLGIDDLKTGNYVNLVDEQFQVALPESCAERFRRYKIVNNLIGTREFCPFVRLTSNIRSLPSSLLKSRAESLLSQYAPDLLYRAVRYLFVKETKSSFAIERETPSQRRMDAFVSVLNRLSDRALDRDDLVSLQNEIVDARYRQSGWRTDQVYVGETLTPGHDKIHFIAVKPKDVSLLMEAFLDVVERWISAEGADPVIAAAVLSFAFVFIHPFDDGNGRIHRYLMHYVLARMGFTPRELIFPVSAVLLKKSLDYDRMLETFSRRVMARVDYVIDGRGEVSVTGDSIDFYRYVDYTPIVEAFQQVIAETIDTEWRSELDYLREYDLIRKGLRGIVDMPDKKANQFILFVRQNGGRLSARKRDAFSELTDEEIARMEAVVAHARLEVR